MKRHDWPTAHDQAKAEIQERLLVGQPQRGPPGSTSDDLISRQESERIELLNWGTGHVISCPKSGFRGFQD
jgi:hypothetical protein